MNTNVHAKAAQVSLVLGGVFVLIGVLFLDWPLEVIMYGFWLETVIIGFLNVVKLLTVKAHKNIETGKIEPKMSSRLLLTVFFCIHFGLFLFFYYQFLGEFFEFLPDLLGELMLMGFVSLLTHGFSLVKNWFILGEKEIANGGFVFIQPYGRIVVMHVAILAGAFFILTFDLPVVAIVILVALKIFLDLFFHSIEHMSWSKITSLPAVIPSLIKISNEQFR